MVFLKAEAFFNDHTQDNIRLLIRAETEFPLEWLKAYKRIVAPLTPMRTGALRRSIITRTIPHGAEISWRSLYVLAQDKGGHTVSKRIMGPNQRDGGFGIIMPGLYRYSKYTTPGTGPDFAAKAAKSVYNEVPAMWRKIGLTK